MNRSVGMVFNSVVFLCCVYGVHRLLIDVWYWCYILVHYLGALFRCYVLMFLVLCSYAIPMIKDKKETIKVSYVLVFNVFYVLSPFLVFILNPSRYRLFKLSIVSLLLKDTY